MFALTTKQPRMAELLNEVEDTLGNDLLTHEWFRTFQPLKAKNPSFPPYNVIKEGGGNYLIEMAIAGMSKKDIEVVLDNDMLTVKSIKEDTVEDDSDELEDVVEYIHRGIAQRSFMSRFRLPEHSEIESCKMKDGILNIKIFRNIPEEKLPKVIKIT